MEEKDVDIQIFHPRLCEKTCAHIMVDNWVIHVCRLPRGHKKHECNCGATWEWEGAKDE